MSNIRITPTSITADLQLSHKELSWVKSCPTVIFYEFINTKGKLPL